MKKYRIGNKRLTAEELADAVVFPHGLSKPEKDADDAAFIEIRKKALRETTAKQKLTSRLLQLKFELEDYLNSEYYDPKCSFSYFLKEYLKIIDRKKKDFAGEIHIHQTKLSQLLNDRVDPNESFVVRLEIHSGGLLPAIYWYKLVERKKENELISDKRLRTQERKFVKNPVVVGK